MLCEFFKVYLQKHNFTNTSSKAITTHTVTRILCRIRTERQQSWIPFLKKSSTDHKGPIRSSFNVVEEVQADQAVLQQDNGYH